MKFMNDKAMQFLGRKLEDKALKIANNSMKKSCVGLSYEPKSPFVKKMEQESK
ncbi:cyclic lactone autoinducer peptide [Listeria aquatica]|uniref:Cyclic lactone autoinducer peptide n=1 Tax=Listeria aquatica TaxID=1494960 RepID=A0A841ZNG0_9LIST|nr:cyclic lactone autoinducer peptide [Listeria aquatica]MBC1522209.1 cyclic lactone autoinducer peptide [Listeria aquatica]